MILLRLGEPMSERKAEFPHLFGEGRVGKFTVPLYVVGDSKIPRSVCNAVHEGFRSGVRI